MRLPAGVLLSVIAPASALYAQTTRPPVDATVAAHVARTIAKDLATRIESGFVYPEQGKQYAAAVRANAAAGKYDALNGFDLARTLGEDLQRVAPDGHLRVMYQGMGGGGGPKIVVKRPPDAAGSAPSPERQPVIIRMSPPPEMEQARWIAPGIAFVRFNLFPGEVGPTKAASQFMATHANAKTIIFDLRTHMGGGLDEMDAIFPWLFAKPTRLATMATRKSVDDVGGSPVGDGPSMRRVRADPNFVTREHWATPGRDRRLIKARVFVLTSGFTASAAEHFALAFKTTRRGVLIGRATYGANHFGGDQDLGGGYTAFIPVGRTFDPVNGKDWEGVGIAPDIDVAPEDALIKAITLSGVSLARAITLSAEVAPKGPMSSPR
jgi:C-terminal processing protease CtpA/Prc